MDTSKTHGASANSTFEANIGVGDKVRSFDFPGGHGNGGRDIDGEFSCYVEGVVKEIGRFDFNDCDRYKILVTKRVFRGEPVNREGDDFVYPPVNGVRKIFGGVTDGVEKIHVEPCAAHDGYAVGDNPTGNIAVCKDCGVHYSDEPQA